MSCQKKNCFTSFQPKVRCQLRKYYLKGNQIRKVTPKPLDTLTFTNINNKMSVSQWGHPLLVQQKEILLDSLGEWFIIYNSYSNYACDMIPIVCLVVSLYDYFLLLTWQRQTMWIK